MRKGQRIGINSGARSNVSEKYIHFVKSKNKYKVFVPIHAKIGKQTTLGMFVSLEEAIMCRDKYLSAMDLTP